jgi:hypothetical protein
MTRESFWKSWPVLLVAGPSIWILHFFVVYLWAEAACSDAFEVGRTTGVVTFVVVATALAVVLIALLAWRALRLANTHTDEREQLFRWGAMLGALSIVATLFVGLPALYLSPC